MTSVRKPKISPTKGRPLPTHYSVLGVPPASSYEKIHEVYLTLAKLTHPDTGSNSDEGFKAIALAWGTLKDKDRRRDYDKRLQLEFRLNCPTCRGKGLRNRFVGREFVKDALCENCEGTGEV